MEACNISFIIRTSYEVLVQGRYRWRHSQVLKEPGIIILRTKGTQSTLCPLRATNTWKAKALVREGQKSPKSFSQVKNETPELDPWLEAAGGCRLAINLSTRDCFNQPQTIPGTVGSFDEDCLYHRTHSCMEERSLEAGMEMEYQIFQMEEGCRGFVTSSTIRLLWELWGHIQALWQTIRAILEAATRSSQWIWLKQEDPCWAPSFPRTAQK